MARPEKKRNVFAPPSFDRFKPIGVRVGSMEQLLLSIDEYEALRLADYDGLEHSEAADKMMVSRPTFTRLVTKARQKIAKFLVEGKFLQIEGGAVHFSRNLIKCLDCGNRFESSLVKKKYKCPVCGSNNCEDLAKHFGHGRCCRRFRDGG